MPHLFSANLQNLVVFLGLGVMEEFDFRFFFMLETLPGYLYLLDLISIHYFSKFYYTASGKFIVVGKTSINSICLGAIWELLILFVKFKFIYAPLLNFSKSLHVVIILRQCGIPHIVYFLIYLLNLMSLFFYRELVLKSLEYSFSC